MTKIKLILLATYSINYCASINDLPESVLQKVCEFAPYDKSLSRRHSEISQPLSKQYKAHELVQLIDNFNNYKIDTKVFVSKLSLNEIHLLQIKPVRSFFMHFQNMYRLEINEDAIKKLDARSALDDESWSRLISFLKSGAEFHKFCDSSLSMLNCLSIFRKSTNEKFWKLGSKERKTESRELSKNETELGKLFEEKSLMKKLNRYLGKHLYHERIKGRLFRQGSFGSLTPIEPLHQISQRPFDRLIRRERFPIWGIIGGGYVEVGNLVPFGSMNFTGTGQGSGTVVEGPSRHNPFEAVGIRITF